ATGRLDAREVARVSPPLHGRLRDVPHPCEFRRREELLQKRLPFRRATILDGCHCALGPVSGSRRLPVSYLLSWFGRFRADRDGTAAGGEFRVDRTGGRPYYFGRISRAVSSVGRAAD